MNAPPFPLNPRTGEWFQNWVWNGARWVNSPTTGLRIVTQTFTDNGPYMPTPGLVTAVVECIGPGGGGGQAGPSYDPNQIMAGGGGASGGYSRSTIPAALVRGGVLVTVGPPAEPGLMSSSATSFGALVIANAGGAGIGNDAGNTPGGWGQGGTVANPGVGDVAFAGNGGQNGITQYMAGGSVGTTAVGGMAGAIFGGTEALAVVSSGSGLPGTDAVVSQGGGGSGAVMNQMPVGTAALLGGYGGGGLCIVTEYCWGDQDQSDIGFRPPLDVNVNFPSPPWPGGPWPPGVWWPPGPGWGPGPWPSAPGPGPREALEAGQPYDQSINPETGQPWEDE